MDNGPACLHLQEAVREALQPCLDEDKSEAFLLADALITESLGQVVWGELLVALRWHFVGNPISGEGNSAADRKASLTTQERNRVGKRSIIKDAINVKLS